MAGDGTNSAFALSLSFSFRGRNTIGHRFLYLAFVTGIKLWWSADGTFLPATVAIPVRCTSLYMNILTTIKNIFSKPQTIVTNPPISLIPYDYKAYVISHQKEIEEESKLFIDKYGNDFTAFFYRQNLDIFIRKEILPFRNPNSKKNTFLDNSYWKVKHPFNFPGPFYTGESDTCCTGEPEAPNNVMSDENAMEFVFRQPQTFVELLGVVDAAYFETFDSYSCDGNKHWTYSKCKEWWKNRFDFIAEMNKTETTEVNGDSVNLFENYLKSEAEKDLKRYCYFLENGNYPNVEITALPQLD
jgi:hypothetical protein